MQQTENNVFRILDANFNRLREALRVLEEYYRLFDPKKEYALTLKDLRHLLTVMESGIGISLLLQFRDTLSDPFAKGVSHSEMKRESIKALVRANMKRAQEACRVIEEYSKLVSGSTCASSAKSLRFSLYELEKKSSGVMGE